MAAGCIRCCRLKSGSGCPDPCWPSNKERRWVDAADESRRGGRAPVTRGSAVRLLVIMCLSISCLFLCRLFEV